MASLEALEEAQLSLVDFQGASFQLVQTVLRAIVQDPPLLIRQGGLFEKGFDPKLDELIDLTTNTQQILQGLEEREKNVTGISSLKIRYNGVFGYSIEITNTHAAKAPGHYIRRQTLANAERYTTP